MIIAEETMLRGMTTQQNELKKQKRLNLSLEMENAKLRRDLAAANAAAEMYRLRLIKSEKDGMK